MGWLRPGATRGRCLSSPTSGGEGHGKSYSRALDDHRVSPGRKAPTVKDMTPAGQPAASRPTGDHRATPHPTTSAPAAGDDFGTFLAEARARRARADAQRTKDASEGAGRPQDWADPDPDALSRLRPGQHPVDRALARSKEGETRRTFRTQLGRCLQLLTGVRTGPAIAEDVHAYPWHQLTVEDAAEFRRAVYRCYRPQSCRNDAVCAVRRVVRECYRAGLISSLRQDLLMEQLYTVAVGETTRRRRLSPAEVGALLVACANLGDARTTARNTAIVALFYTSGMRISELVHLELADWDRADQSLLLRETKNGRSHRVLLHPGVLPYLERWADLRGPAAGALFTALTRTDTAALCKQSVRLMLQTRAQAAGIAPFGPHDFRRTFATAMLERHDPFVVSRLLNHSKIESTMRYDLRGEDAQRDAVATLDLPDVGTLATHRGDGSTTTGRAA